MRGGLGMIQVFWNGMVTEIRGDVLGFWVTIEGEGVLRMEMGYRARSIEMRELSEELGEKCCGWCMVLWERGRYEEKIFGHMRMGIRTVVMMGTTVYNSVLSIGVLKIKIYPGNESASHY